jgi:hypothetical protein
LARINIEECWWADPRRSKLSRILQSEDLADARAIRMWRLAQEFWKDGRRLVPRDIFETLEDWEALIECRLADDRGDEIYVRGSSQHLDWLFEKKKAGQAGGKVSAQRPRDEKGRLLPQNKPSNVQAEPKQEPSKPKQVQASYSSSYSSSGSKEERRIRETSVSLDPLCELWNSSVEALPKVTRWTTSRNRKLKTFLKTFSGEDFAKICEKVQASDFLSGRSGGWGKCGFDWVIKPDNATKILEGNYDNQDAVPTGQPGYRSISQMIADGDAEA